MKTLRSTLRIATAVVGALFVWHNASACSSAIISAKLSKEGAPILWKHRDQKYYLTPVKFVHVQGDPYGFTALMGEQGTTIYAGINEAGFGVMTTATKNLPYDENDKSRTGYKRSTNHYALGNCRTVDDFEELLRTRRRTKRQRSNYGVGDATGAVAYFEVWHDGYRRYDVHTTERGYDVRTNFSFAGDDSKRGASERRYDTVMKQLEGRTNITTLDMLELSRSFFSAAKGEILDDDKTYLDQNWCVPRRQSVASIALVCDKENPRMDIILGNPIAGIAVPVWVKNGHHIPNCLTSPESMELGKRYTQKAYVRSGKRGWALNKPLVREVLNAQTRVKIPARPPKNIARFNAKIDNTFDRHCAKIDKILQRY